MAWKPPHLPSLRGQDAVPLRQILLHLAAHILGVEKRIADLEARVTTLETGP